MSDIINTKFFPASAYTLFFVYRGFHYICRMLNARKVVTINNCLSNIKPNKIDKKILISYSHLVESQLC